MGVLGVCKCGVTRSVQVLGYKECTSVGVLGVCKCGGTRSVQVYQECASVGY